jgi:hypothetical protein
MNHWKNLLQGVRSVLVLRGDWDYVRPQGGFRRDVDALRRDGRRVITDFNRVAKRHDQPVHHGKA